MKKLLLQILQYSQDSNCVGDSLVFNSEYCKIFQSTYIEEYLRAAASKSVYETRVDKEKIKKFNKRIFHKNVN